MSPRRRASTSTDDGIALSACIFIVFLLIPLSIQAQQDPVPQPESEPLVHARLVPIKRVCVQGFGPDVLGQQAQEIVIAKLFESRKFSLTEDCDRADYVLKGSVTERATQLARSESEGIGFGERVAASESSRVGDVGSSSSASTAVSGSAHESLSSSEAKIQALVTLRIVDKEGEIIWATIQESPTGKSKGAVTLAAEQAVRRLLRDKERAEKQAKAEALKN